MNIAILAGGYSYERDVSLTSASLIANALIDEGYDICLCDVYLGMDIENKTREDLFNKNKIPPYHVDSTVPDLSELKRKSGNGDALIGKNVIEICRMADVVFLALHGSMGENGQLQATLDNYGIKYTGSGYVGSLLAMDKDISKQIFSRGGVNTPAWKKYEKGYCNVSEILNDIGLPCVIKPCSNGSSVGVSIAYSNDELTAAITEAFKYEDIILVEKKIEGRELTVGILDGETLPAIEIIPTEGFYDYKNKYQAGKTLEICPAPISREAYEMLCEQTKRAFKLLRLKGYARLDFILDKDGVAWCLEANTLPGMTPTSLLPQMAAEVGISYGELCSRIIRTAK